VRAAFAREQPLLLALPEDRFPSLERLEVTIGKTPYARFDLNDYSVPPAYVRRPLSVLADTERVRIAQGATIVAEHRRSYDRGQQIEDPAHIQALVQFKRAARQHRATDQLARAVPATQQLLVAAAARGYNLGSISAALGRLLSRYTPAELQVAVLEALAREVPHPNAVQLALEQRRELRGELPPTPVSLPEHLRARDVIVQPHALGTYDQLMEPTDEDEPKPDQPA
jgi:hypothetical protein